MTTAEGKRSTLDLPASLHLVLFACRPRCADPKWRTHATHAHNQTETIFDGFRCVVPLFLTFCMKIHFSYWNHIIYWTVCLVMYIVSNTFLGKFQIYWKTKFCCFLRNSTCVLGTSPSTQSLLWNEFQKRRLERAWRLHSCGCPSCEHLHGWRPEWGRGRHSRGN